MNNKKPNLFLIGFQKCGSTSLFDFVIQHPEIQGTSKKETFAIVDESYEHFDAMNSVSNDSFDWSNYLNFSAQTKYFLEASVCNFYQKTAKDYISRIDNAKVIFVVRNPIDRFVSTYNYYGGSGIYLKPGTSISEYYDFVMSKESKKEAMNFALEHGRYLEFIDEWQSLLGKENVLVLGMNEIIRETSHTAVKLSNFLNIENLFPLEMSYKNKSEVVKFKKTHLFLRKIFGGLGLRGTRFMQLYKKLNKAQPEKTIVPQELKQTLLEYYQEEYKYLKDKF